MALHGVQSVSEPSRTLPAGRRRGAGGAGRGGGGACRDLSTAHLLSHPQLSLSQAAEQARALASARLSERLEVSAAPAASLTNKEMMTRMDAQPLQVSPALDASRSSRAQWAAAALLRPPARPLHSWSCEQVGRGHSPPPDGGERRRAVRAAGRGGGRRRRARRAAAAERAGCAPAAPLHMAGVLLRRA